MKRLLVVLALTACGAASAAEPTSHRFTVYAQSGVQAYLSRAQTAGVLGGGVGVRDTLDDRFILQADLSYLVMLGNVGAMRLGAGVQRQGVWTPAALVTGSVFFGDRLRFLTSQQPQATLLPGMALGLVLAPARFTANGAQISVLELGLGAGWDFPGGGTQVSLTFLQVGVALP